MNKQSLMRNVLCAPPPSINAYAASPRTLPRITETKNSYHAVILKSLSTTAASASSTHSSSGRNSSSSRDSSYSKQSKEGNSKKEDNSNIFLDNLGKIFLSSIALVLLMLLRSTRSNNARKELVEELESNALLDPLEIDDLRLSNSEFTIEVWEGIAEEVRREFPGRDALTYPEFLSAVTRKMRDAKGEGFTIQLGHLVDRVVIAELERTGTGGGDGAAGGGGDALLRREMPLPFLFAALSLALNGTVADRVRVLFESASGAAPAEDATVPGERASRMVQHLQDTCQLVPGAQVVETNSTVPYQTFRVGTGEELTRRARGGYGGKKGHAGVTRDVEGPVTLEDFHAILKSRAVCAWGECYVKKTGRTASSDR